MKCYKEVFSKDGLISNSGFYIIGVIILINIFLSIYFKIKGFHLFCIRINEIIINNEIINIDNNIIKKKTDNANKIGKLELKEKNKKKKKKKKICDSNQIKTSINKTNIAY